MNSHRLRDINAVLVVLAVAIAVLLAYQMFKPLDVPMTVAGDAQETVPAFPELKRGASGSLDSQGYDKIVELNLFSSEREPPSGRAPTVSEEDEKGTASYEGMELIGTVLSDEERSIALIRKGGLRGEIKAYHLRDDVGGLELREILYDKVVLSKGDKAVVLLLQPREEEKKATSVPQIPPELERRAPSSRQQQGRQQSWNPRQRKDR
jgi:type II secretory pathway component PulC